MDKITIFYWPLRFRGNFLKLILEEAGVNYEVQDDIETIKNNILGNYSDKNPMPTFAPPALKIGE